MPKKIQEISVFVSSPGDVVLERGAVSEVCEEINLDVGRRLGFRIQPITWESHTVPQKSGRSQEAINDQIEEYDVYLGIMAARFGTDTGIYGSGTALLHKGGLRHDFPLPLPVQATRTISAVPRAL
ncbi:DUF4062 domain-containing protein, partial [Rhodovulum euryhalinum]|uniref:DUF4062 domain-containing protein n=1 Tax=Rhodovulum euryhalinum TaxID=35805 RepID=UPI0010488D23